MKLKDDMERRICQLKLPATPEFRQAARDQMFLELDKVDSVQHPPVWRVIMSRKSVRYATASSIIAIALASVAILFALTGDNHAVALAQVLEKIEAMSTMVLQEQAHST